LLTILAHHKRVRLERQRRNKSGLVFPQKRS
jgi:hypothetical protein